MVSLIFKEVNFFIKKNCIVQNFKLETPCIRVDENDTRYRVHIFFFDLKLGQRIFSQSNVMKLAYGHLLP